MENNKSIDIRKPKREKGKSLLEIKKDYTVIDIESTGFLSEVDDILEISAIKVRTIILLIGFHIYLGQITLYQ